MDVASFLVSYNINIYFDPDSITNKKRPIRSMNLGEIRTLTAY